MLLSPGEHAAQRGVVVEHPGQPVEVGAQQLGAQLEPHPRRRGDASRVAHQAVAQVDHRGGAGRSRHRALLVRRARADVLAHQIFVVVSPILLQQNETRGRTTQRAGDGDHVSRARARAQHRVAVDVAEGGDRDHEGAGGRGRQVAARDRDLDLGRRRAETRGEVEHPRHGGLGVGHERHEQRGGPPAHRGDVGDVLRDGLAAHVGGRGPLVEPVTPAHHRVGRGQHAAVRRPHQRGVVTRRDDNRAATGQKREDLGEQLVLADVAQPRTRLVRPTVGHVTPPASGNSPRR